MLKARKKGLQTFTFKIFPVDVFKTLIIFLILGPYGFHFKNNLSDYFATYEVIG